MVPDLWEVDEQPLKDVRFQPLEPVTSRTGSLCTGDHESLGWGDHLSFSEWTLKAVTSVFIREAEGALPHTEKKAR